jgi:plasmid stability protein
LLFERILQYDIIDINWKATMSDILIRNVPAELKRQIEERARAHKRSLSREIEALLQRALAQTKPLESRELEGGLGTELARLFPKELRSEDFVLPSRDDPERPPPTFD